MNKPQAPWLLQPLRFVGALLTALTLSGAAQGAALGAVGEGRAKWGPFTVYDATLYAPNKQVSSYLDEGVPLALRLCYARSVKVKDILKATNHAVKKPIKPPLAAELNRLNRSLKDVDKGDCYRLDYAEGTTRLSLNNKTLFQGSKPGFKALYFGIWIGVDPLSKSLKSQLLR